MCKRYYGQESSLECVSNSRDTDSTGVAVEEQSLGTAYVTLDKLCSIYNKSTNHGVVKKCFKGITNYEDFMNKQLDFISNSIFNTSYINLTEEEQSKVNELIGGWNMKCSELSKRIFDAAFTE